MDSSVGSNEIGDTAPSFGLQTIFILPKRLQFQAGYLPNHPSNYHENADFEDRLMT
jgi:hypothetical protein